MDSILAEDLILFVNPVLLSRGPVVWRRGYTVLATGNILLSRDPRLAVAPPALLLSGLAAADAGEYVCQVTALAWGRGVTV